MVPIDSVRGKVLTIGHSTHMLETFIGHLQRHDVTAVADVRSSPYSRFNPQYNREHLADALQADGIKYVYLGQELGGRSEDRSCYRDGRVCYGRVVKTESFRSGLDRVIDGAAKFRIALMCSEREPLDCHRTLLVAQSLVEQGINVEHILADGVLETHSDAMDRLLVIHKLDRWNEGFLSEPREELINEAIERQSGRVAYVEEEPAGQDREKLS